MSAAGEYGPYGSCPNGEPSASVGPRPVRVLVVDDEPTMLDLLARCMRREGWEVYTAADAAEAADMATRYRPDAVVLDVMLPGVDGPELLRRWRSANFDAPVLFLSARATAADWIAGLTSGGDDYLTKPFSLEEVVGRLHELVSRTRPVDPRIEPALTVGDLTIREFSREVRRGERRIWLTDSEFTMLRCLMRQPNRVLSAAQIHNQVWLHDFGGNPQIVDACIQGLRQKIDTDGPVMIHGAVGTGYFITAIDS
jgi:two-component system OmpR family response regulator